MSAGSVFGDGGKRYQSPAYAIAAKMIANRELWRVLPESVRWYDDALNESLARPGNLKHHDIQKGEHYDAMPPFCARPITVRVICESNAIENHWYCESKRGRGFRLESESLLRHVDGFE